MWRRVLLTLSHSALQLSGPGRKRKKRRRRIRRCLEQANLQQERRNQTTTPTIQNDDNNMNCKTLAMMHLLHSYPKVNERMRLPTITKVRLCCRVHSRSRHEDQIQNIGFQNEKYARSALSCPVRCDT